MDQNLSKGWCAYDALAKAMIRRMEVLPWISELTQQSPLKEPSQCLACVSRDEKDGEHSHFETVQRLDRVTTHFAADSKWGRFAQDPSFGNVTMVPPIEINGMCAMWGLKHYIQGTVRTTSLDLDYLLQCASLSLSLSISLFS